MVPTGVPERLIQINAVARLPPTIAHGETCFRHCGSGRDRDDHSQRRADRIRRVRLASRLRFSAKNLSKSVAFVEKLSARWELQSEPTALPLFPYNQLQLG